MPGVHFAHHTKRSGKTSASNSRAGSRAGSQANSVVGSRRGSAQRPAIAVQARGNNSDSLRILGIQDKSDPQVRNEEEGLKSEFRYTSKTIEYLSQTPFDSSDRQTLHLKVFVEMGWHVKQPRVTLTKDCDIRISWPCDDYLWLHTAYNLLDEFLETHSLPPPAGLENEGGTYKWRIQDVKMIPVSSESILFNRRKHKNYELEKVFDRSTWVSCSRKQGDRPLQMAKLREISTGLIKEFFFITLRYLSDDEWDEQQKEIPFLECFCLALLSPLWSPAYIIWAIYQNCTRPPPKKVDVSSTHYESARPALFKNPSPEDDEPPDNEERKSSESNDDERPDLSAAEKGVTRVSPVDSGANFEPQIRGYGA